MNLGITVSQKMLSTQSEMPLVWAKLKCPGFNRGAGATLTCSQPKTSETKLHLLPSPDYHEWLAEFMQNLEEMCKSWAVAYGDIPEASIKFIDIHLAPDGAIEVVGRTSCIAHHPLFYRQQLVHGESELYWGMTLEELASFGQIILDNDGEVIEKVPRNMETKPPIPDSELPNWIRRK